MRCTEGKDMCALTCVLISSTDVLAIESFRLLAQLCNKWNPGRTTHQGINKKAN